MADSVAFETACVRLEESGAVDRLVARGTIRLVLKKAGLEPKTVTANDLAVAVERLLPAELSSRGIADPDPLCGSIARAIESLGSRADAETPEAIFARLGNA